MSNCQLTHITEKPRGFRKANGVKSMIILAQECTSTGSTYFSGEILINSKFIITMRFQYGYSDSSIYQAAIDALFSLGMIDFKKARWGEYDERKIQHYLSKSVVKENACRRFGRGGI